MPTPIPLSDCPGLIDLMLGGEQHGPSFTLDGVRCSADRLDDHHARFEAVAPTFGLMVVYPGWYAGEHGVPIHILIAGDAQACVRWLPIDPSDKRALIDRLPLDQIDKTMCRLAV